MFERYKEKARRVIFFARYEASEDGSPKIEVEHLLAGLLRENSALLDLFLTQEQCVDLQAGLQKIRAERLLPRTSTSVDLPLSDGARRVLAYAAEEAEKLEHKQLGPEHLFLALLREESSVQGLLNRFGLQVEAVRDGFRDLPPQSRWDAGPAGASAVEARRAKSFAEGCLEIIDVNGSRLAIVGLTATAVIPRIREEVQLCIGGYMQTYSVVDAIYRYEISSPESPNLVNHLSAVQVVVKTRLKKSNPTPPLPDTT